MELYRDIDIQAITDKLDQIVDDSIMVRNKLLEPTIDECRAIHVVINDFVMKKKRIIYGGTAYNELIKLKKKTDAIYRDIECKDIEFYTPKPLDDLIELANILHEKKFKYVQAKQAMHAETYTIFVNFEQVCDMSYMPSNVFTNMPTITIGGILYAEPLWILVDILRQYNDPITSYWRLKDKTFFRASKLLKYYPLKLNNEKVKQDEKMIDEKKKIFEQISDMKTLIFLGSVAETYYKERSKTIDTSFLECYSVNLKNDFKVIYKLMEKILGSKFKKIKVNVYKPFYQFRDDTIEITLDGIILLKIYGNNGICIPFHHLHLKNGITDKVDKIQLGGYYTKSGVKREIKDKDIIKIGTFMVVFNNLLIERHYQYINRSENYKIIESKMSDLLKARSEYLKKHSMTVIDNSPFKEFIIKCSGETIDQGREFRLKGREKKSEGKRMTFTYDPSTQKNTKAPDYKFNNTSGNLDTSGIKHFLSK